MSGVGQPLTLLSSSAFSALVAIRGYITDHGVDVEVAVLALAASSADFSNSNVEIAKKLHHLLPASLTFADPAQDMRAALALLIEQERPWWRKMFPSGRSLVSTSLTDDERQAFADAELFQSPPTKPVMSWWYQIQAQVRAEQDVVLSDRGGEAELWTLDYERERLQSLGITLEPELKGFENNALGYDVKSYDLGSSSPIARLIEVKSSTAHPPRIVLPRREWDAARDYGAAYRFYLWWGAVPKLAIFTTPQMATHIPQDQGEGEWQEVEITFAVSELVSSYAPPS